MEGPAQVYNLDWNLSTFQEEEVALPAIAFTQQATNTLNISVASDDVNDNNHGLQLVLTCCIRNSRNYSF